MVIWLVGLSGSGKTTIGNLLYESIKSNEANTVLIDGDVIRDLLETNNPDKDYSVGARRKNAEFIVKLCQWLDSQNINVVCNILCIFDEILIQNRVIYSNYFEIFLDVPFETLVKEDSKGIYASAIKGESSNVVGVDIEFAQPGMPDIRIINDRSSAPETIAEKILSYIKTRGK